MTSASQVLRLSHKPTCCISHTVAQVMPAGHCCLSNRKDRTYRFTSVHACMHSVVLLFIQHTVNLRVHDCVEGRCAFVIINARSKQVDHAVTLIVCGLSIHADGPLSFAHAQHHTAEGLPHVLCNLLWRWLPLQLLQLVAQLRPNTCMTKHEYLSFCRKLQKADRILECGCLQWQLCPEPAC